MIELKNVSKSFVSGGETITPVDGVDLSLAPGEFAVVTGPSGSGKSTLLSVLGLLLSPDSGQVLLGDQDVQGLNEDARARLRARQIGFVFQDFNLLEYLSACENVRLARRLAGVRGDDGSCEELLRRVGLGERMNSLAQNLSGGEKQRVAVCRALVNSPRLLLADEPTGNLDTRHGEEVVELLKTLVAEREMASLVVTHDEGIAAQADVLYEMRDGRLSRA